MNIKTLAIQLIFISLIINTAATIFIASGYPVGGNTGSTIADNPATQNILETQSEGVEQEDTGIVDDFIGGINAAANLFEAISSVLVTGLPDLLEAMGTPSYVTNPLKLLFGVTYTFAIAAIISGRIN